MAGRASYSVNSREALVALAHLHFAPTIWAHFTPFAACLSHACHYSFSTRCARSLFTFFGAFPSLASLQTNIEQATACMEATTLLSKKTTYIMHEILWVVPKCDQTIRQQRHNQPGLHRLPFLASALFRNRWAKFLGWCDAIQQPKRINSGVRAGVPQLHA
jgi:hypothetical protein